MILRSVGVQTNVWMFRQRHVFVVVRQLDRPFDTKRVRVPERQRGPLRARRTERPLAQQDSVYTCMHGTGRGAKSYQKTGIIAERQSSQCLDRKCCASIVTVFPRIVTLGSDQFEKIVTHARLVTHPNPNTKH